MPKGHKCPSFSIHTQSRLQHYSAPRLSDIRKKPYTVAFSNQLARPAAE
jgi:hypothetical protein